MSLAVQIEAGATVRRGQEAQPGDRLILRATADEDRHAELRVYRNDRQLVLRCSQEPPCIRRGDTLEASLTFDAVGTYQSVLLTADEPLPAPGQGLDADTAAALDVSHRGGMLQLETIAAAVVYSGTLWYGSERNISPVTKRIAADLDIDIHVVTARN